MKRKKRVRRKKRESRKKTESNITGWKIGIIAFLFGVALTVGFLEYLSEVLEMTPSGVPGHFEEYVGQENVAFVNVPALSEDGQGVTTTLIVKAEQGTGKTLVDINSLLFWIDTQNSIRMAKIVAQNYTQLNLNSVDLTYSINANASLIGGESAGAALTVATIAALQNLDIREDITITGSINHDGSLGPVGGILEKAKAARQVRINKFLVPLLQSNEITYEEREHCEKFGLLEWCTLERIPKEVDIREESGIEIVEVGHIGEAMGHFIIS